MNRNVVGSTYGMFCIKFPQNRIKGKRHRLSPLSLQFFMTPRQRVGGILIYPCSSVRSSVHKQIHGLFGYLLLQFWSYSFNILQDVYTHNGGVHINRILVVRRGHHLCLTDTLHFFKITPNKTIIIKCGGMLLFQFKYKIIYDTVSLFLIHKIQILSILYA